MPSSPISGYNHGFNPLNCVIDFGVYYRPTAHCESLIYNHRFHSTESC